VKPFEPMLAATCKDIKELRFPVWGTPKFDGIRCLTLDRADGPRHQCLPVCRSLNHVPNHHIRNILAEYCPPYLDGELMCGKFNRCQSSVMSEQGMPEFTYHVFDHTQYPSDPYVKRVAILDDLLSGLEHVHIVRPIQIDTLEELERYESKCVLSGFEGVIIRTGDSPYKFGRSTFKQQWMVKLKRFEDAEAAVIGFEEEMHNGNPVQVNLRGHNERSSHQERMTGKGRLGALVCRSPEGIEFRVGSGFTADQRENIWQNRNLFEGMLVTYKHQPHGRHERPRIPIFKGFRHKSDISKSTQENLI
jgi:DNA ligase-1